MGTKMKETVKGKFSSFNTQIFAQVSDTPRWFKFKVSLILFLVFTTGPKGVRSEDIGNPLIPGGTAMDSFLSIKNLRGFKLSERRQMDDNINYKDFPRGKPRPNSPGRKQANSYRRPCNTGDHCRQGNKGKKN